MFLKISQCFQKTLVFGSFFNNAAGLKACIFIKKEIPTQVFSWELCEIFKNSFLVQHFLFIILICDDRLLWTSLGTKLTCFIVLVLLIRIGNPYLFRTCFYTKVFSKRNFSTHDNVSPTTILIESLKTRNSCRTLATSPSKPLWKMWIWVFEYYALLLFFFRSCLAVTAKNNPT